MTGDKTRSSPPISWAPRPRHDLHDICSFVSSKKRAPALRPLPRPLRPTPAQRPCFVSVALACRTAAHRPPARAPRHTGIAGSCCSRFPDPAVPRTASVTMDRIEDRAQVEFELVGVLPSLDHPVSCGGATFEKMHGRRHENSTRPPFRHAQLPRAYTCAESCTAPPRSAASWSIIPPCCRYRSAGRTERRPCSTSPVSHSRIENCSRSRGRSPRYWRPQIEAVRLASVRATLLPAARCSLA